MAKWYTLPKAIYEINAAKFTESSQCQNDSDFDIRMLQRLKGTHQI